ncbi:SLAP domain-containing protein [Companilactobacillus sp. HBUAS59699]|uniref:SLAP domain-containing protein n=1 Tax=Companilactobacillus sp. HBUAS59699 TaxID=3109358 RepID=UPI002FEFC3AB
MKKSKSLVITSLLFSTMILNPSMINAVVVNAADAGAETPEKKPETSKTVTIHFTDNSGADIAGVVDQSVTIAKTATDLKNYMISTPANYRVSDNQDLKVSDDNKATIKITKTKKISISFLLNGSPLSVSQDLTHDTVDDDATTIDKNKLHLPKGYILENGTNDFKIVQGKATIHVTDVNKQNVSIVYLDGVKKLQIVSPAVTTSLLVPEGTKSINASDIQIPTGYTLSPENRFEISSNSYTQGGVTVTNRIVTVKLNKATNSGATDTKPSTPATPTTPGKPGNVTNGDNTVYTNTIQFINKATNKIVGSANISGINGSKHTVVVPDGFELAKNESSEIKIDKSVKAVHIQVVQKGTAESEITAHKTTFRTNKVTQLFDNNGKAINNRALMSNTSWAVDKMMVLNGVTYYRVATNEWVLASDLA